MTIITSDIMKGAVEQLFNHEVERNGKCSSHSQLERWIIEEMKLFTPSNTVFGLRKVLKDMRGIDLEIDLDDDLEVMTEEFGKHNMYVTDTGGGCQAFRTETIAGEHYQLVTVDDGSDIPCDMNVPVCFGMYTMEDELIFSEHYTSAISMFQDKHIVYLLSR